MKAEPIVVPVILDVTDSATGEPVEIQSVRPVPLREDGPVSVAELAETVAQLQETVNGLQETTSALQETVNDSPIVEESA